MAIDRSKVAKLVADDRQTAGPGRTKLSQAKYAPVIGLTQGQISKIESLAMKDFEYDVIRALTARFGPLPEVATEEEAVTPGDALDGLVHKVRALARTFEERLTAYVKSTGVPLHQKHTVVEVLWPAQIESITWPAFAEVAVGNKPRVRTIRPPPGQKGAVRAREPRAGAKPNAAHRRSSA